MASPTYNGGAGFSISGNGGGQGESSSGQPATGAGATASSSSSAIRPRYKHNCLPCRKRKSKCDRVFPCSQCVMRETCQECYSGQEPLQPSDTASSSSSYDALAGWTTANNAMDNAASRRHAQPQPAIASSSSSSTASISRSPHAAITKRSPDATHIATYGPPDRPVKRSRCEVDSLGDVLSGLKNIVAESRQRHEEAESQLEAAIGRLSEHQGAPTAASARPYQQQTPAEVTLAALRSVLPSEDKCELLLDVFFIELDWFIVGIYQPWFRSSVWEGGLKAGKAITCAQGALLCAMLAMAAILVPPNHPRASDLVVDRDLLIDHAMYLVNCDERLQDGWKSYNHRSPTLPLIQSEMIMTYYMMYSGRLQAAYHKLGSALRRAKQIGLFDSRNRQWSTPSSARFELLTAAEQQSIEEMSNPKYPSPPRHSQMDHFASFLPNAPTKSSPSFLELEMKQRLAWDLVILDWWHGLCWRRPPDLPTNYVNLPLPSYLRDEYFDPKTGDYIPPQAAQTFKTVLVADEFISKIHLTQLVPAVRDFTNSLHDMSIEARVQRARSIDARFDAWTTGCQVPLEEARQGLRTSEAGAHRKAAQTLINHTSAGYLRCLLHKCFLGDTKAPDDLRNRALIYARGIMEAIPVIVDLCDSSFISFDSSLCSEHLFHAATAFAYILLKREESATTVRQKTTAAPSSGEQELTWFAKNVSEIIFTLRHLGARSETARVSERILSHLCESKESLRATMKRLDSARQRAVAEQRGNHTNGLSSMSGATETTQQPLRHGKSAAGRHPARPNAHTTAFPSPREQHSASALSEVPSALQVRSMSPPGAPPASKACPNWPPRHAYPSPQAALSPRAELPPVTLTSQTKTATSWPATNAQLLWTSSSSGPPSHRANHDAMLPPIQIPRRALKVEGHGDGPFAVLSNGNDAGASSDFAWLFLHENDWDALLSDSSGPAPEPLATTATSVGLALG
ncbi:hypothetical protein BDZ90DRAFT_231282 [Jaminaea rosea]|uniref:Zn(2)-C6 fungal-type domain-containing protein n=1 Tax=Jaminaea rosea TaxID=1569628 RepID=A0A316UU13_9BASI|nr:hypothetical protein BDZ90DRAFT_231282 [Jaminaea rosea]PWN28288.1 hypothetical protein BDZ90DRAFT_231282 [Jaminaea rosea]